MVRASDTCRQYVASSTLGKLLALASVTKQYNMTMVKGSDDLQLL